MHKDLSDGLREFVELQAGLMAMQVAKEGDSLAIARQATINAFDKAAAELDTPQEVG